MEAGFPRVTWLGWPRSHVRCRCERSGRDGLATCLLSPSRRTWLLHAGVAMGVSRAVSELQSKPQFTALFY